MLPLEGIRVIDLSTFLAASTAARVMGEWGAEVIKVETPKGDVYRTIGPTVGIPITEKSNPNFDMHNACKRFVALNLRSEEGMAALHKLLETADVFVTNNRIQALQAMHLDYDSLKDKYPRLIFAHALGYGERGPRANTAGFDYTAFWSRSGLLRDLPPKDGAPCNSVAGMGDHSVSIALVAGVCACLARREKTGKGDKVDSSLLQMATWLNMSSINSAYCGREISRTHFDPTQAGSNAYECKDGKWIFIAATDYYKFFPRLVGEAMKRPDILEDPRFNTREASLANKRELVKIFDDVFKTRDRAEWDERLNKADVAHELVQHFSDMTSDEQALANNYVNIYEYEDGNKTPVCPPPVHFGTIDYMAYEFKPSKAIGADNDAVLAEIGYSAEQIADMRSRGVVV